MLLGVMALQIGAAGAVAGTYTLMTFNIRFGTAPDSGLGVNAGVELRIPLSAIGSPTGLVRIYAFINGVSHDFVSNQILAPIGGGGNFGEPRNVDFGVVPGLQYVSVDVLAEAALPLDSMAKLVEGGGSTDEAVLSEALAKAESTVEAMKLARRVYDALRHCQSDEGVINANSLYFILDREYSIQSIQTTLALLQSELIGAVGATSKGSLYTRMPPPRLTKKLSQLSKILESEVVQSDQPGL